MVTDKYYPRSGKVIVDCGGNDIDIFKSFSNNKQHIP